MKYISFIASLFFLSAVTGCSSASSEKTAAKAEDTTAAVQTIVPATSDTNSTVTTTSTVTNTPTMPVVTSPTKTVTIGSPQPASISPATTAGLNPEHGKPGHRCDIAVGAPLDSKPAATTAVAPQPTITNIKSPVINTTPAKAATTTATGPNPEHGKPGHRCDIAVGAPLDSKPAATVSTQPATAVSSTPVINTNTPAAGTPVAAGLNPEHGKPGHRCDIAVGAPLDSKPKQ